MRLTVRHLAAASFLLSSLVAHDAVSAQAQPGAEHLQAAVVAGRAGDTAEFLRLMRLGVNAGNRDAMHHLGHAYERGTVVPIDEAEAAKLFMSAADLGDRDSQHHIGVRLLEGRGVARDAARGLRYLERSARANYGPAYAALRPHADSAYANAMGSFREGNVERAVASLVQARTWGHFEAGSRLAEIERREDEAKRCAIQMIEQLGYQRWSSFNSVMGESSEYVRITSGTGASARGDRVDVNGPTRYFVYTAMGVSAFGFIGVEVDREIPLSGDRVVRFYKTTRRTAPSARAQADVSRVMASCRR